MASVEALVDEEDLRRSDLLQMMAKDGAACEGGRLVKAWRIWCKCLECSRSVRVK
jgi:hypothetical protein